MSYIPSTDAGLEAWALNFKTLLAASPTTYGLTAGNATSVTTVYTAWHSAYLAAADLPSRTKIQVQAKNTAKTNLLAIVRPFAQQIRANAAVLDADNHTFSSHPLFFALFNTASHTFCVSSASRNVGGQGLPVARDSRKSATWWMNVCS